MRWFRFHGEALENPKIQKLRGELFKAWVNLMCLACEDGGRLPNVADIAFRLRMNEKKALEMRTELVVLQLVDEAEGCFIIHDWEKWQFNQDVSTERVKRFRERSLKRNGNGNGTVSASVSVLSSVSESGKGSGENSLAGEIEVRKFELDARYSGFYALRDAWPEHNRVGEDEAARLWIMCVDAGTIKPNSEDVLEGLTRWKDSQLWADGYIHSMARWMREKMWKDNPLKYAAPTPKKTKLQQMMDSD